MMNPLNRHWLASASVAALVLASHAAQAQDKPANDAPPAAGDIVVTAQKRSESIQKVPINITAIGSARLATLAIRDVQDLTAYVPSFRVTEPGDPAVSALTLRGVGQRDINVHNEGAVAEFVDQAYVSFIPAIAQPLFDVERIEVLKGPQGTLFGRNATGGLISIVNVKPSQTADGYASVEYGSYNEVKVQAAQGGALSPTLSARLSVAYNYADGYIKNSNGPALNAQNSLAGRLQLKWEPTPDFRYTVSIHGWRFFPSPGVGLSSTPFVESANGTVTAPASFAQYAAYCGSITHGAIPTIPGAQNGGNCFGAQPDPYSSTANPETRYEQSYYGFTGTGEWDVAPGTTLTSITDYQHLSMDFTVDESATPTDVFDYEIHDKASHQFSQELRLNGSRRGLQWVTGLYFLDIQHNIVVNTDLYNDPGFGVLLPAAYQQHTVSEAVFGQADIAIVPTVTLSAGLRGIHDYKSLNNVSTCEASPLTPPDLCGFLGSVVFPGAIAFNQTYNGHFSADSWSGRAVLEWKPTALAMVYGGVTRGTKGGGFNSGGAEFYPASEVRFAPETLVNYEAGVKASTPDHKFSFDGSAFYYDYHNYQSFAASTDGGLHILNVNATVKGIEAAVTARPERGLSFSAAGTYLDTIQKNVPLPTGGTGRFQMPDAPKWSLDGEVRYGFPVRGGDELAAQLNAVYVGQRSISAIDYPAERIPAYHRFDARLSYQFSDKPWTMAVFVDNFTNEKIIATRVDFVGQTGAAVDTLDRPRWFGGSLTMHWH